MSSLPGPRAHADPIHPLKEDLNESLLESLTLTSRQLVEPTAAATAASRPLQSYRRLTLRIPDHFQSDEFRSLGKELPLIGELTHLRVLDIQIPCPDEDGATNDDYLAPARTLRLPTSLEQLTIHIEYNRNAPTSVNPLQVMVQEFLTRLETSPPLNLRSIKIFWDIHLFVPTPELKSVTLLDLSPLVTVRSTLETLSLTLLQSDPTDEQVRVLAQMSSLKDLVFDDAPHLSRQNIHPQPSSVRWKEDHLFTFLRSPSSPRLQSFAPSTLELTPGMASLLATDLSFLTRLNIGCGEDQPLDNGQHRLIDCRFLTEMSALLDLNLGFSYIRPIRMTQALSESLATCVHLHTLVLLHVIFDSPSLLTRSLVDLRNLSKLRLEHAQLSSLEPFTAVNHLSHTLTELLLTFTNPMPGSELFHLVHLSQLKKFDFNIRFDPPVSESDERQVQFLIGVGSKPSSDERRRLTFPSLVSYSCRFLGV